MGPFKASLIRIWGWLGRARNAVAGPTGDSHTYVAAARQQAPHPLDFSNLRHHPVKVTSSPRGLQIGPLLVQAGEQLDFGAPLGCIPVADLYDAAVYHARTARDSCSPQLAALLFLVTDQPVALNGYFPLTRALDEKALAAFYQLAEEIGAHPGLDLRLIDEGRRDITEAMPRDVAYLVAGQLAEIFFYRRDILERLLGTPRHIWLYTTPRAFSQDGGVAGGNYNSATGRLQLVLSRLYEGFYSPTPGVAPFLHEFGHMLDFFDASTGAHGISVGLLPGLRPADGAIYTPLARELFLEGKRLELERYQRIYHGAYVDGEPLPIGHPYVFQNDTEFVAGYFEMFFRNPHYFAAQNPDLYHGLAELFRQDPRRVWVEDFPFYVRENRNFYLSGQRPSPARLTIHTFDGN